MPRRRKVLLPQLEDLQLKCSRLDMFLCGCPLWLGMHFIFLFHFIVLIIQLITSYRMILYNTGVNSIANSQTFFFAFNLAGTAIIFVGFIGTLNGDVMEVYAYLAYLVLSCLIDLICEICFLAFNPCNKMAGTFFELLRLDDTTMCPTFRFVQWIFLIGTIVVESYVICIVRAYCQRLSEPGKGLFSEPWTWTKANFKGRYTLTNMETKCLLNNEDSGWKILNAKDQAQPIWKLKNVDGLVLAYTVYRSVEPCVELNDDPSQLWKLKRTKSNVYTLTNMRSKGVLMQMVDGQLTLDGSAGDQPRAQWEVKCIEGERHEILEKNYGSFRAVPCP